MKWLMTKGYLILQDGTVYEGLSFGAKGPAAGEVVFNTGMMGYPESFTDPSYQGQILTLTFPLIGNYGVPGDEKDEHGIIKNFESENIHIKGLIVSEYCENPSHWNMKKTLGKWLKENNVPALQGIDTRALTQKLREKGTMLGKIALSKEDKTDFYDPNVLNIVDEVSCKKVKTFKAGKKTVVLIDCGAKLNIIRSFLKRNITVIQVPWNFDFIEKGIKCHGVMISNGPGDPAVPKETHEIIKKCMAKKIPTFGICLGNQMLAIAAGAKTYKLPFGHRAQNQPCIDLKTGRCYITSQNHGFAIKKNTIPKGWEPSFINANDKTIEGMKHKTKPFMSVQFHPEATPGPIDTGYLFDEFIKML